MDSENMNTSEHFENIERLLPSPAVDKVAFMKCLQELLGDQPDQMAAFVRWRASQERRTPSPPPTPASEILSQIKLLDCRQEYRVVALTDVVYLGTDVDIPLAKDDSFEYIIRTGGQMLDQLCVAPAVSDSMDLHGCITELHTPPSLPSAPAHEVSLPRFVQDFGHLWYKDLRNEKSAAQGFKETDYIAVIDVTTPKKPVWLVYDYCPENPLGDREPVVLDHMGCQRAVFPNVTAQFDTAQILASVHNWNDGLTPRMIERRINETGRVAEPVPRISNRWTLLAAIDHEWSR
ncbi:hypothetical protein W97_08921 [Coniosporium apollinis CBS 100218]|uniref:Uncharacterized protein n=1 Tax=Coniosporium apollinis (strain CBS 100218) TaxID=1168221 RepID=R7Z6P0_CONA1|nr:uncharacterized protein W97_08921 [Coniosporium apollinis CBS 100218]EON69669.1 hypothetical protein W97_08921 [Coniosporium apollinis CBS 100218]